MDFSLSSEQRLIFDTAYEFGQSSIAPFALEWERSLIPKSILKEAGKLGFASLYVDEEDGGSGLSRFGFLYAQGFRASRIIREFKGKLTSFLELFALVAFPWSRGPLRVRCS